MAIATSFFFPACTEDIVSGLTVFPSRCVQSPSTGSLNTNKSKVHQQIAWVTSACTLELLIGISAYFFYAHINELAVHVPDIKSYSKPRP